MDTYNEFEEIKVKIENFIYKNNRFPNRKEIIKQLDIKQYLVEKYNGVMGIKKLMGWTKNELVDLLGFYNKSKVELEIANYLILNNISYKREQLIIENRQIRSDFLFSLENGKKIHCEVWGYDKNRNTKQCILYNKQRKEKELIYKENNIEYISIEVYNYYNIFRYKKYDDIQEYLYGIFNQYLNYPFINIDYTQINITNNFIYSINNKDIKDCLTNKEELNKNKLRIFNKELCINYEGKYNVFIKQYNKNIKALHQYFIKNNKEYFILFNNIILIGLYMMQKYNKILNLMELKEKDYIYYNKIKKYLHRYNISILDFKLEIYNYCLNNNVIISDVEIEYIKEILIKENNNDITLEQYKIIKDIYIYNEINKIFINNSESLQNIKKLYNNFNISIKNVKEHITLKDIILIGIEMMNKYNKVLNYAEAEKLKYEGYNKIRTYISAHNFNFSTIYYKLEVYQYCLKNDITISAKEIKYIKMLVNKKGNGITNIITNTEYEIAKEIYNKLINLKNNENKLDDKINFIFFEDETNLLTDEEILNKIMEYNNDTNYLLSIDELEQCNLGGLLHEINKRYSGGYREFAQKFNKNINSIVKPPKLNRNILPLITLNDLILAGVEMIKKYNKLLSSAEIPQLELELSNKISRYSKINNFSMLNFRLEVYKYCLENDITIPEEDIKYIKMMINKEGTGIKNLITEEQSNQAKEIYNKIENEELKLNIIPNINNNLNSVSTFEQYLKEKYKKKDRKYKITLEEIIEIGIYMIQKYNKILTLNEAKKLNYKLYNKIIGYIPDNNISMIDYKLEVYKYCLKNNIIIPEEDIKYIKMLINKKGNGVTNIVTEEQSNIAKQIYNKISTEPLVLSDMNNNSPKKVYNKKYLITLDEIILLNVDIIKKYNKILSRTESKNLEPKACNKIRKYLHDHKLSTINFRIKIYNYCIDNNIIIPKDEIKYIETIISKQDRKLIKNMTEEEYEIIKNLYNKITNNSNALEKLIEQSTKVKVLNNIEEISYKITFDEIVLLGVDMIKKHNKILGKTEASKLDPKSYNKIRGYLQNHEISTINFKLEVYNYCLNNNIIIPTEEIQYIEKLITKKGNGITEIITEEECIKSKEIYNRINDNKINNIK